MKTSSQSFTTQLIQSLSAKHLLKHEFYQGWNTGSVPTETLCLYAKQYYHHVNAFPRYISATHSNCNSLAARQLLLQNLVDEENGPENHPELWLRFAEGLGVDRKSVQEAELLPETRELVECFLEKTKSSYAEGLGAVFAYEHQVPEIAAFKAEALKKHYSVTNSESLAFFDVHQKADVYHTQALTSLMDELSPQDQEKSTQSAKIAADHLWKFLDAIYRTMPK